MYRFFFNRSDAERVHDELRDQVTQRRRGDPLDSYVPSTIDPSRVYWNGAAWVIRPLPRKPRRYKPSLMAHRQAIHRPADNTALP